MFRRLSAGLAAFALVLSTLVLTPEALAGTTPNYGWGYPTVGADADTWGATVNATIVSIDGQVKTVADAAAAACAKAGCTYTGAVITAASASGGAGFRLPHGAAPTSPTNGDEWTTSSGAFLRLNGSTKQFAFLDSSITGSAASLTTGRTIGMTGDVTWTSAAFDGSGNVTGTATLATVNSNVGSFGSSTVIPVVTVNAKGLVTAVSTATVSALPTQTGNAGKALVTDGTNASWSGYPLSGAYMGTVSGTTLTNRVTVGGLTMTRSSTGVYVLTLPSAASSANSIVAVCSTGNPSGNIYSIAENSNQPRTSSTITYQVRNNGNTLQDPDTINCMASWS